MDDLLLFNSSTGLAVFNASNGEAVAASNTSGCACCNTSTSCYCYNGSGGRTNFSNVTYTFSGITGVPAGLIALGFVASDFDYTETISYPCSNNLRHTATLHGKTVSWAANFPETTDINGNFARVDVSGGLTYFVMYYATGVAPCQPSPSILNNNAIRVFGPGEGGSGGTLVTTLS